MQLLWIGNGLELILRVKPLRALQTCHMRQLLLHQKVEDKYLRRGVTQDLPICRNGKIENLGG